MTTWRSATGSLIALAMLAALLAGCGGSSADETEPALASSSTDGAHSATELEDCLLEDGTDESIPQRWIESALGAIRRDIPAPTVHARNLWHASAAMWDTWAAFAADADPIFGESSGEQREADDEALREALSYAAYTVLRSRYAFAVGSEESIADFDALMRELCLDPAVTDPAPTSPAAVGLAAAQRVLEFGIDDGSNELEAYIDLTYQPVNEPLVVDDDTVTMDDPDRWQPLLLQQRFTQGGQLELFGPQVFIGSQWGSVASFALPEPDDRGVTIDPGPPPLLADTATASEFRNAAVELIAYSDALGGPTGEQLIDISPGARGNNEVGRSDGSGHAANPATGDPYEPNEVPHQDFARAIAEYWADGPESETPPGHWNVLAMKTSDGLDQSSLRWAGEGDIISRLEWDLRMFATLNAGLHDAAIAVWGSKRAYDYARPISIIRYLGSSPGESLPLVPGLVEQVTDESAGVGSRHEGFAPGDVLVRSWDGPPLNRSADTAGVAWRLAIDWLPYQQPTFVTPAFAGYVSGHSGFSRAAADLLAEMTGSAYFPGGLFTHDVPAMTFRHEAGPSAPLQLQWATYGDAADEAGESRLYGGIHVPVDDVGGRLMGAEVADLVWAKMQSYMS